MSTAILNIGKNGRQQSEISARPARVKNFIHRDKFGTRLKRFARSAFYYGFISAATAILIGVIGFAYFYNHYSAIVEQRVKSGFWHSRAGIYAAPLTLKKDQKTSREKVVEMLRRAGYVEGNAPEQVWNGSFIEKGGAIEIKTNNYYNLQPETAIVRFSGNQISAINNGKAEIEEYNIEPEMISGRTETKRGENHVLKYEEIPENLRHAILTAEDQRFFEHYGVDPKGIARALVTNISEGRIKQGGSTITQQLVKNTFLSPEKTFGRKFSEAFLALALESKMTKEEIFALYCNEIYLGQYGSSGVHGVEQAARAYFDKDLNKLSLAEAAAIAAMIKNPNRFAPHKNEESAKLRREFIIAKMAENGIVSQSEAENSLKTALALAKPKLNDKTIAPYFVDAATKELSAKFSRDYLNTNFNARVYTTIDTHLQNLAERAVSNQLAALDKTYAKKNVKLQASLVAIDPRSGHILAMVGGRDYRESQFNRATDALRQPGSTFKPFVYAAALERGKTPLTIVSDRPTEFRHDNKPYKPANFGNSYAMNEITLKTALAKSSNVAAVEIAYDAGLRNVARKAEEFGFKNVQPYPSMALGAIEVTPLELAAAYAVFANGGRRVEPTFIDRIVSGENEMLYLSVPGEEQIIDQKTAYMITDMLEAVVERGTARSANGALGREVVFAGKTGSSNDGWFVGYTPNLVTVAWIGVDETEDIKATGGEVALPLWTEFMKAVVQTRPEFGGENFTMPKGLTEVAVDPETGMIADNFCPHREMVVAPASAVSNIKCLRHQPKLETYTAVNAETFDSPETVIITPASETETISLDTRNTDPVNQDYKQINGVPAKKEITEKPRFDEPKNVEKKKIETYYNDYLDQNSDS